MTFSCSRPRSQAVAGGAEGQAAAEPGGVGEADLVDAMPRAPALTLASFQGHEVVDGFPWRNQKRQSQGGPNLYSFI